MSNHPHIQLLTDSEIQDIYSIPTFNLTDRQYYFSLNEKEKQCFEKYKTIKSKVYFILLLGYFKASKQLHKFTFDTVGQDYHYIIQNHFPQYSDKPLSGQVWKENYRQQKADVLHLTDHQEWSEQFKTTAFNHLIKLIRLYPKGHDTLREFCLFLEKRRIILPSYRTLQNIFTQLFKHEKDRLNALIEKLPKSVKDDMGSLLINDEGITQLNIIRTDQKDFNYRSIRSELKKVNQLTTLYQAGKTWLPSLKLSDNAIRYYAMLTEQYTASRLRRLSQSQQYFHTLCFIHYRYQEIMDNLITSFLVHVCGLRDEAREYAREKENEHAREMVMNFPKLVEFLHWFSAGNIKPTTTCRSFIKKGFSILPKVKQRELAAFIEGHTFDNQAIRWEFYQQSSNKIARYLRPILLAVDFDFYKSNSLTMALIETLRDFYSSGSKSPKLLPKHLSKKLLAKIPLGILAMLRDNSKKIHPAKFEFYVYEKIYHQMDRGRLVSVTNQLAIPIFHANDI